MAFEDHFSGHAADYARNRPSYPADLFAYLAGIAPTRGRVWDCATGSGQAGRALAEHFDEVIATDASAEQIANARAAPRVSYRVAPAEQSEIGAGSVDLVTVAQALHWFDLKAFYEEVRRVVRPSGVLAVWCYELAQVSDEVDAIIGEFYKGEIGEFWPAGRRHIETAYRELSFPFESVVAPPFEMALEWSSAEMLAYVRTWSAVQRYAAEREHDPVDNIVGSLARAWGQGPRRVRWPLTVLVGIADRPASDGATSQ